MRIPAGEDALTLPELIGTMFEACYTELMDRPEGEFSDRMPMISTLRRNLQADMTDRLIAVATNKARMPRPVRQQCLFFLRQLEDLLSEAMEETDGVDTYTLAHLMDMHERTVRALEAVSISE
jgi:hypothetical protein